MPLFRYNELLTLVNPYYELVVKDPDGLKKHGPVFAILFRHEKYALALQMMMECPQSDLYGFRKLTESLVLNHKKNDFYLLLKDAALTSELLFNLMNPGVRAPHELFLDKNSLPETVNLLKNTAWFYQRVLQNEKILNCIACRLIHQAPSRDIPLLLEHLNSAFENTQLPARTSLAFKADQLLIRLAEEDPVDIFLDKAFDISALETFPDLVRDRLSGLENRIAHAVLHAGPERTKRIKTILSALSGTQNDPDNPFDLIYFKITQRAEAKPGLFSKNRFRFHGKETKNAASEQPNDTHSTCILS